MPRVVVNRCFGGFQLSDQALEKLKCHRDSYGDSHRDYENRACPNLAAVVEMLGKLASTALSEIVVVEVPTDAQWYVSEYDGLETIREGRTWPSDSEAGGDS